jgi:hypothetical protein
LKVQKKCIILPCRILNNPHLVLPPSQLKIPLANQIHPFATQVLLSTSRAQPMTTRVYLSAVRIYPLTIQDVSFATRVQPVTMQVVLNTVRVTHFRLHE